MAGEAIVRKDGLNLGGKVDFGLELEREDEGEGDDFSENHLV